MHRLLILLFAFSLAGNVVFGQEEAFVFTHLKESDGLNSNIVNCIIKGSKNKLWIGTYNGFNSFDGANFYAYKIRKGNNSLLNEVVHSLCEDQHGIIWGATNNGLFSYNPVLDSFTNYELKSAGKTPNFFNILCDKNGNIWATGIWSLFKYNRKEKKFEEILKLTNTLDTSRYFYITKNGLAEEKAANRLWITTAGGLWFYDYASNRFGNSTTEINNPLFAIRNTAALHKSGNGNFWLFDNTTKSIIQFDPVSKTEKRHIYIGDHLPNVRGATIFEDRKGRIWFSSWTYEMLVIDPWAKNTIQRLYHKPGDSRTIAGNFFWMGYQDPNNTIWLGTVTGISRCNPEKTMYKEYRLAEYIPELKKSPVLIAEQDPVNKSIWILTKGDELFNYDPDHKTPSRKYLLNDSLKKVDKQGPGNGMAIKFLFNKMILTSATGSWQLDKAERNLIPFRELPPGFENFKVTEIAKSGDSVICFNSGKQLLYWNRNTSQTSLIHYKGQKPNDYLFGLCLAKNQQPWLINSAKNLVTVKNGTIHCINLNRNFSKEHGVLWKLLPDSAGNLWLQSRGAGIYFYDTKKEKVKLWNITDGLAGNRMHEIEIDNDGKVWSILYDKVSVLNASAGKVYNFTIPYSEDDLGYDNHLTKLSNGNILGTVYNELVEFFPERMKTKPVLEKPTISLFKTKKKSFTVLGEQEIMLNTDENTVGIRFGCLISNEIFPYEMQYKLVGGDNEWINAEDYDEIMFTNLAAGSYTFKVRARGKNNAWQTEEASLSFRIKKPFYKTYWFILSIIALIATSAVIFYRYRLKQKDQMLLLESKAQMLEKEKAMVMYENLKQHLNPHFLFNSLTSLSSLIRIDQDMADDFLDKMSKVYRYILRNRDKEVVPLTEEMSFVQMYIDLQKTRFNEGLQVNMNIDEEHLHRKIAPVTLQNLVENAIKHNTADEDSPLIVDLFIENDYLIVRNNLQKKKFVETSNRQGLANMESLYRFLSSRALEIIETEKYFTVKIPLI